MLRTRVRNYVTTQTRLTREHISTQARKHASASSTQARDDGSTRFSRLVTIRE